MGDSYEKIIFCLCQLFSKTDHCTVSDWLCPGRHAWKYSGKRTLCPCPFPVSKYSQKTPVSGYQPERCIFILLSGKSQVLSAACIFSMTNAWRCYYFIFLLYSGLCYGLLFTFCTLLNGLGGIPQFLCFLLPQAILSIPLFLILLKKLEAFHTSWFLPENNTGNGFLHQKKRVLLIRQFPLFLVFILLLLVSSLLEGYLNLPLIQYFNFGL